MKTDEIMSTSSHYSSEINYLAATQLVVLLQWALRKEIEKQCSNPTGGSESIFREMS